VVLGHDLLVAVAPGASLAQQLDRAAVGAALAAAREHAVWPQREVLPAKDLRTGESPLLSPPGGRLRVSP
jgi:hypothetical protein